MKILQCDSCASTIAPDAASYFAADHFPVPVAEVNDDGTLPLLTLTQLGEHEFHFCSPTCLAEWAFGRSINNEETP